MKNFKLAIILFACLNMAIAGNNIAENDLQFDADKKLSYHNVSCKEQLDGYSFVADFNVSACGTKTLYKPIELAFCDNEFVRLLKQQDYNIF